MMGPRISVSLASVPFFKLDNYLDTINKSIIEMIHFDIEDGIFVPSIKMEMKIIEDLRPQSTLVFDVHLMVINPEDLIPDLIKMGADRISFHWEASRFPLRTLNLIKSNGALSGIAFNPVTPIPNLDNYLPSLDFINVLSTEPDFKKPMFIDQVLYKIKDNKKNT